MEVIRCSQDGSQLLLVEEAISVSRYGMVKGNNDLLLPWVRFKLLEM